MAKLNVNFKRLIMIGSLSSLILTGVYAYVNQFHLVTDHFTLKNSSIPISFDNYTIVHLSDLHGEAFGKGQSELIEKIEAESPDLIVVSGDTLDNHYGQWENSLTVLRALSKKTPVYFVTGNHEYWTRYPEETVAALQKTGAIYLKNETVALHKNGETIYLSGIDDPWYFDEEGGFDRMVSAISATNPNQSNTFSMLISHRPERQESYASASFDLTFSGHAHGGQVRLPFTQGLIAPNQGLFPSLTTGLHKIGDQSLLVSRGLGNPSKVPRFFNPPEIVVLTLKHE
jgi:predicted MPP superfamily phosphohydrolase